MISADATPKPDEPASTPTPHASSAGAAARRGREGVIDADHVPPVRRPQVAARAHSKPGRS